MHDSLRLALDKYRTHPQFLGMELNDVSQKGALDDTVLHIAAQRGAVGDIEFFLAKGADINEKGDLGNTALHVAAMFGEFETSLRLLQLGADPDDENEFGQTAADVAKLGGRNDIAAAIKNFKP